MLCFFDFQQINNYNPLENCIYVMKNDVYSYNFHEKAQRNMYIVHFQKRCNNSSHDLAESYINTGSLYLCASVFLPLGLLPSDPFWAEEDMKWTSARIAAGENVMRDQAIGK